MRGLVGLLLAITLIGCGAQGGGGGPLHIARLETPGSFVLIGGGDTTELSYQRFVRQAGGPGAPIAVIPFASGAGAGEGVRQQLEAQGAEATVITGQPANREAELDQLRKANGIYVEGGVVDKLTDAMQPYLEAARTAWQAGCVVGGTSAGAMVWGDRMIVRGDADAVRAYGLDETHGAAIKPGLGWLTGVTVDPHFNERERMYRLWLAAGETHTLGLGIDEGTMAIVSPSGKMRVLGGGTVTVIRPEGAAGQPARLTILKQGDQLDWKDWAIDAR